MRAGLTRSSSRSYLAPVATALVLVLHVRMYNCRRIAHRLSVSDLFQKFSNHLDGGRFVDLAQQEEFLRSCVVHPVVLQDLHPSFRGEREGRPRGRRFVVLVIVGRRASRFGGRRRRVARRDDSGFLARRHRQRVCHTPGRGALSARAQRSEPRNLRVLVGVVDPVVVVVVAVEVVVAVMGVLVDDLLVVLDLDRCLFMSTYQPTRVYYILVSSIVYLYVIYLYRLSMNMYTLYCMCLKRTPNPTPSQNATKRYIHR